MPTPIRAELHSHSTFSDGEHSPRTVAELCHERGVRLWSLTDHDTCAGCADAMAAAEELGIDFIPGIEVSAYEDRSIHVLGYGVDPESDDLQQFSTRRQQARRDRMAKMIDKLRELGVAIEFADVAAVSGEGSVARPHLARALHEGGHVDTVQDAFDRYIAPDGPAYVATTWPRVPDAIALIHSAGGVAVLAHPGIYGRDHRIQAWVEAGLDGIEVGHPDHDPDDVVRYMAIADDHGLLKTASSDFHGPSHDSGGHFGTIELDPAWIDALQQRLSP